MEQISESPLTPLGQQLAAECLADKPDRLPRLRMAPWTFLVYLFGPAFVANISLGSIGSLNQTLANHYDRFSVIHFAVSALLAACLAMYAVQSVLIHCYAVFSCESGWLRAGLTSGLVAILFVAGVFGIYLGVTIDGTPWGDPEVENTIRSLLAMPVIMLAAQLPLWFLRMYFGWQLIPAEKAAAEPDAAPHRPQRLLILHMLLATTFVALALACLRVAPLSTLDSPADYWLGAAIFAALAAGTSAYTGWYLLLTRKLRRGWQVWAIIIGIPLLVGVPIFAIVVRHESWDEILGESLFGFSIFVMLGLSFLVGIAGGLRFLRAIGWRIGPRETTPKVGAALRTV